MPQSYDGCVSIFCSPSSIKKAAWSKYLDFNHDMYGAFGIHPHHADAYTEEVEADLLQCHTHKKAVAWGEMGLDYFKNFAPKDAQIACFRRQLEVSLTLGKPLVIHTREAEADTLAVFKDTLPRDVKMHIHCFTSHPDFASEVLQLYPNVYFGFTGIVTRAANVQSTVRDVIPLKRILLETDGPYLRPKGARGKCTHPGHIPLIAKKIADLKGVSVDEVYRQCRKNTFDVYGI